MWLINSGVGVLVWLIQPFLKILTPCTVNDKLLFALYYRGLSLENQKMLFLNDQKAPLSFLSKTEHLVWIVCSFAYTEVKQGVTSCSLGISMFYIFYLISSEPFASFVLEPFCFWGCRRQRGWCQAAASSLRRLGSRTKPALCGWLLQPQGNCCMSHGFWTLNIWCFCP